MTIGQLVEGLVGKCAAIQGMDADGTVFEEHDFESAKDTLEKLGHDRNGYEYMYNGMTGEKMLTKIFLCPTFYQRLKHLVEDKIHSRSRGAVTALTRQALLSLSHVIKTWLVTAWWQHIQIAGNS